jgi:hypothetical protein
MELTSTGEKYKNLIQYATLAASGHNTQPWHFSVNGNRIQIQPDKTGSFPWLIRRIGSYGSVWGARWKTC